DKDDDRSVAEQVENAVEGAALGEGAETHAASSCRDEVVQPTRFEGPAYEVEQVAVLRKLADPRHRRNLPVAQMTNQKQKALSFFVRGNWYLHILNPAPGLPLFGRHQRQAHQFDEEPREVSIVGMRQADELAFG